MIETDGEAVDRLACPACGEAVDLHATDATLVLDGMGSSRPGPAPRSTLTERDNQTAVPPSEADDSILGGYSLDEEEGRRLLGTLYRGTQVNLRRTVSLYVLDPALGASEKVRACFLAEARKTAGLVHPNLARVFDVLDVGSRQAVASERIEGGTLEAALEAQGMLDAGEALLLAGDLAQALDALHGAGLVQCFFPASDIILPETGEARLLHAGLAKALFRADRPLSRIPEKLLSTFAPETLAHQRTGPASDLYSLGAILFKALTGSPPFDVRTLVAFVQSGHEPPVPDIRRMRPETNPLLAEVIQRLLQPDPAERFKSIREVVALLQKILPKGGRRTTRRLRRKTSRQPSAERQRAYRRFSTEMNVVIEAEQVDARTKTAYMQKLRNISETGAFVQTGNPLPVGSFVRLEFTLERNRNRVSAIGLVRWVDATPGNHGMGVQFVEVSTTNRKKLSRFVEKRSSQEVMQTLARTALHKTILRQISDNFGRIVSLESFMRGTGASRMLFDRAMQDFVQGGLVELKQDKVYCRRPRNDTFRKAIERVAKATG